MKKLCVFLLSIFVLQISASAHNSSQSGVLDSYYLNNGNYNGWYIGGETVGWGIDEDYHTNMFYPVTYSFGNGCFLDVNH